MSQKTIVVKYGGNAMTNDTVQHEVLHTLGQLHAQGHRLVMVHGGGPFIQEALALAKIESEFIDGHRKTSVEALRHVEMALKGRVNGTLVGKLNALGHRAVGLSGKDGGLVLAKKRYHEREENGVLTQVDLGQVGDVAEVRRGLLDLLLDQGYFPVVTCLAADVHGQDFNINGDVFAGHIAGALDATDFIVLTDVDGVMRDIKDPDSIIRTIRRADIPQLVADGVLQGGMIPKIEACETALEQGAATARILNGTQPSQLLDLVAGQDVGTLIIA